MTSNHTRGEALLLAALTSLVSVGWLACGGNATKEDDDGSPGGAGGDATAAGAGGTAGSVSTGGSGTGNSSSGGAPGDCTMVPTYLDNLLDAAAACAPADPVPHCQGVVEGFCCPVVVESATSPATLAYLDFLELTKTECPEMWERCAAVDCALPSAGTCVPTSVGEGQCEPEL